MAHTVGFGTIRADEAYTLDELAYRMGAKQARTVREHLRQRGCPMDVWGGGKGQRVWVSGRLVIMAIERASRCLDDENEACESE
jgi:hypothetical protein